ncbi:MAG: aldehyde ferredoxin oxidoreductase family protein [Pedobacter sp.]|jgi:aldehyde:ferredoxin oxidoreductase
MLGGYWQKIAVIDLTTEKVDYIKPSEDDLKKFIGGSGLGAKLLYENTKPGIDPLGPENVLICMTGPYVGTKVAQSGRWELITKGPLTGVYLEADCGGKWGATLKSCGLDGLMVKGKAKQPVYITIEDDKIEIKKADHLWGKGTFETDEILKEELGRGSQAISIGQAGEKLVKFASIMTDGREGRAAGRGGGGAVMGSKNLKAIACKGTKKVAIARPEPYEELVKDIRAKTLEVHDGPLGEYGTSCAVQIFNDCGDLPIKNWLWGSWDKASKVSGQELAKTVLKKRYHCGGCLIGCGRTVEIPAGAFQMKEGGGPEYETLGLLGSNCLVDDVEAICKGNELCNDYGVDTIEAAGIISFLMEAWEHGMIDKDDTDGLEMTWGNGLAMCEMLKKLCLREGIGEPCSQGILEAVKRVGPASEEFAIHTKGMLFPAHDPRGRGGLGVAYATSNRGACHMQAYNQDFEGEGCFNIADLGYDAPMPPYTNEGKGKFVADQQHFMSMMDSLKLCKFSVFGGMTVGPMTQFLNHITGWDFTNEQWIECGERIFNLKRLFNTREGISRKDDTLPARILSSPRQGGSGDYVPDLGFMLRDYYRARGWDEWGIPTPETLERLGLDGYEYRKGKRTTENQR